MKARVHVTLKNGVLDPQGKAIGHSLNRLGFPEVGDVRQGKFIELELASKAAKSPDELLERLNRLEERANHLRLPTGFANLHYTLRQHIDLVKARTHLPTD